MLISAIFLIGLHLACCELESHEDAFATDWKEGMKEGGGAPPACRDKNSACIDWASKGECEKNSGFMHSTCPLACSQCSAVELRASDFRNKDLTLSTPLGDIRIAMLYDNAPRSVALILDLAMAISERGEVRNQCDFYRVELAPSSGDGPPYGLLQGKFVGLLKGLPSEGPMGGIEIKYGHAATIQGGDFYIAAMDHPGWGSAHTVWGRVENMEVVEKILKETPFYENKHPSYGTVMRMAKAPIGFKPSCRNHSTV